MVVIDHQEGRRSRPSEGETARVTPEDGAEGHQPLECLPRVDEDDSGALSVNELLSGLSKLGIFDSLDKRDVQDLVKET